LITGLDETCGKYTPKNMQKKGGGGLIAPLKWVLRGGGKAKTLKDLFIPYLGKEDGRRRNREKDRTRLVIKTFCMGTCGE